MKILIFGLPGAGKTTLARKLSANVHLPVFHIDRHFFVKGWVERDHDHFLEDVKTVLKKKNWIIDGNGMESLEMRYKEADIAIYCRPPRLICLYRIFHRWLSTSEIPREDIPSDTTSSASWKLIKYLWNYNKRYGEKIKTLKKKYPRVDFFEARSTKEMKHIQAMIESKIKQKSIK